MQHRAAVDHAPKQRAGRKSGVARGVAMVVVFVLGLGLFVWPFIHDAQITDRYTQTVHKELGDSWLSEMGNPNESQDEAAANSNEGNRRAQTGAQGSTSNSVLGSHAGSKHDLREDDPLYQQLSAYNKQVAQGEAAGVIDPWNNNGADGGALMQMPAPDHVLGAIRIPAFDLEQTLFLGSTMKNLRQGACIINGTSAPLGEETSNVCVATHRGPIKDAETLGPGDVIFIDTPWDTMEYTFVSSYLIVAANNEQVKQTIELKPDKDLLTFITCHPYGDPEPAERYVAVFERVPGYGVGAKKKGGEGGAASVAAKAQPVTREQLHPSPVDRLKREIASTDSPELVAERIMRLVGFGVMIWILVLAVVDLARQIVNKRS